MTDQPTEAETRFQAALHAIATINVSEAVHGLPPAYAEGMKAGLRLAQVIAIAALTNT